MNRVSSITLCKAAYVGGYGLIYYQERNYFFPPYFLDLCNAAKRTQEFFLLRSFMYYYTNLFTYYYAQYYVLLYQSFF